MLAANLALAADVLEAAVTIEVAAGAAQVVADTVATAATLIAATQAPPANAPTTTKPQV